jgi:hypothetical protein
MNQSEAAATEQLHEVLKLCIEYVRDPATLACVCLVSCAQRSQIKAYVQQQLLSLVKHTVAACKPAGGTEQHQNTQEVRAANSIDWLLSTAGPAAVGAPAVADVLLRLGPQDWLMTPLPDLAFARGLQLSTQQIVAASIERVAGLDHWIEAAWRHASSGGSMLLRSCNLTLESILMGTPSEVSTLHACTRNEPAKLCMCAAVCMNHCKQWHVDGMPADATACRKSSNPAAACCLRGHGFAGPEHIRLQLCMGVHEVMQRLINGTVQLSSLKVSVSLH